MSKRLILHLLLLCTLLTLVTRMLKPTAKPTAAKFATVERHHVHQVKAITGELTYIGDQYLLSETPGIVSKVYVTTGQRVAANEALVRIQVPSQTETLSSLLSNATLTDIQSLSNISSLSTLSTIRSDKAATVRQVLVQEGTLANMGTPLLRLSSNEQAIRCAIHSIDAQNIIKGQWAWLFTNGEAMGTGTVTSVSSLQINPLTGSTESIVTLSPEQHIDLPEGSKIDVEIYIAGSDNVLTVPVEAITPRGTVWWVNQGRCTEIPAQIVMNDEMYAWVNLPEGLTVAVGEFVEGQLVMEVDIEST